MEIRLTKRKAQSLLETVIAISILIVGVVSLMALAQAMIVARSAAEYETVATNLAREPLEYIERDRQRIWFVNGTWDTMPWNVGSSGNMGIFIDDTSSPYNLTAFNLIYADGPLNQVYQYTSGPLQGFYFQPSDPFSPPSNSEATIYNRRAHISHICDDESVLDDAFCSASGKGTIGVKVTSTVTWTERGRERTVALSKNFYDWR